MLTSISKPIRLYLNLKAFTHRRGITLKFTYTIVCFPGVGSPAFFQVRSIYGRRTYFILFGKIGAALYNLYCKRRQN
jgi:hypothetical protein